MKIHNVTIIASGLDALGDAVADRFNEAGCDVAMVAIQKGLFVVEFHREARTVTHVLVTAMRDVARRRRHDGARRARRLGQCRRDREAEPPRACRHFAPR